MIQITGLRKVFNEGKKDQVIALDGIDLHVERGEIFGIIGLSGAGKSTLLRCINMLERPTSASIIIDGIEMTGLRGRRLREQRRNIGMIFQHCNLLTSRTVFGNIAFPLEISGQPKDFIKNRVTELLKLVELEDKADAYPSQLSGGQKQRVGIARALANSPKVLLSDEATSALDPKTTKAILRLLKVINQRFGLTIVLITHQMSVIKEICDTVAVINNGRVIEQGPTAKIFDGPVAQTTKIFVGDIDRDKMPGLTGTHRCPCLEVTANGL
jgi:D-methionine transport system ATP-binding protein